MCSACGYPTAPGDWSEAGAASIVEQLQARLRRIEVLRRVLKPYDVQVKDNGLLPGIRIAAGAGDGITARDLAEVWQAAERLTGKGVDPLAAFFCRLSP